ncbi:hypothetical protein ACLK19_20850 [Escherichia coli]
MKIRTDASCVHRNLIRVLGDPNLATQVIGGMGLDGCTLVTKNSSAICTPCTLWGGTGT